MKHIIILLACILSYGTMQAQLLNKEAFSLLNLEHPGLEEVKKAYHEDKLEVASQELLKYYRQRIGIVNPFLDVKKVTISPTEQKWADDALQHTFFVHKGYQPSFNYGKDINWQYWPVRDNELRWQLHRHKWFTPMGKAYWLTKDEKYAKEWTYQFMDWIKKNPLQQIDPVLYEVYDVDAVKGLAENVRFAWRPLEASGRLKDQINQFTLFLHSQTFTPEFLTDFLVNYSKHAHHTLTNYSEQGNHLLFEAEYVLCAGIFFPEFTEAPNWRKSGIDILNREIKKQVYDDGGQYELDLGYHGGCINIFSDAFAMAKQNGYGNEFPDSFVSTIKKMMQFSMNVYFPDYTFPCFSDASRAQPFSLVRNYQRWSNLFPDDEQLRYFATQGKEGKQPAHLCHASVNSGFFTFRNGWKQDAVVMTLKAGPKGEWHCQPDNGTFELWFNGKNLFPDSGSFIYGGDEEVWKQRNWFRQTAVHNTLTLDNKNIEATQSITKLWKALPGAQVLVTENPSYKELTHRRSVFFVDNSYFVIVDEAIGNALGTVNLHYQLCDGKVDLDKSKGQLSTRYAGNSNVLLRCFGTDGMQTVEEEGWYSIAYRQRTKRPAVAFNIEKKTNETVRYITVIYPQKQVKKSMKISASIKNGTAEKLEVEVNVDGKKRTLSYELEQEQWATHDDFGQDAIINPSAATYHFDIATGPVKGNNESLAANYQCPEWFRDAKFGIYMHWGLNSIAGYDGHYGRWMYWYQEPDSSLLENKILGYRKQAPKVYQYHLKHFGHPSKFGYKDFIPLWEAPRFNADSLATFYKEIGAKFIGVMAVHHDNFDLYDSSHQPWNSVNMGPKTDIVGAWKRACEKAGVYFAITSHLSNYCHEHMFYQGTNADPEGPYAGVPYDYMNPAYEGLYGKRTADRILRQEPEFAQQWYERTKELVSKYDPDLLYFDGPLPNGIYGQQLAAHFYNTNFSKGGVQQGVLTIKRPRTGFTLDRECSGVDDLQKNPFLVDTTVNPGWFYMGNSLNINEDGGDAGMGSVSEAKAKDKLRMTAGQIVDNLVDIVSKNGNMMLNVGLRADGSLPETFRDELVKIGKWLKLNGEAIYETRPFNVFGEGSFKANAIGDKKYADNLYTYTAEDLRFTTKKDAIYVIAMDWPGNDKTIKVKHLNNKEADKVKSVTFVANGEQLKWQQKEDGLYITMPSHSIGEYAYAFKVNVK